jgi:uncharacterized repeat protein (TIGR03803 family)
VLPSIENIAINRTSVAEEGLVRHREFYEGAGRFTIALLASGSMLAACTAKSSLPTAGMSNAGQNVMRSDILSAPPKGFSVVHVFNFVFEGAGINPNGVTLDAHGNIYGTTAGPYDEGGILYELIPTNGFFAERVLHTFSCATDGCNMQDAPELDPLTGNIFVSAVSGGASNLGTAVEISPAAITYTETGLFSFLGNGAHPYARPLVQDGMVYAPACCFTDGSGGTIVALTSDGLQLSAVYRFSDGGTPYSDLVADSAGTIYGTATRDGIKGGGTVYKFAPSPSGGTVTSLYAFKGGNAGSDPSGPVAVDGDGNVYGVTDEDGKNGFGVVYKLTPSVSGYTESVLHAFSGPPDGVAADGALVFDGTSFWGTTYEGGDTKCNCGIIYSLSPSGGNYKIRHTFTGTDGSYPVGTLALRKGVLYGAALEAGPAPDSEGLIYRYKP